MSGSGELKSPSLEDLIQTGIRTAKQGNKEAANFIFDQVLAVDKRNERAWLWKASLADNSIDQRRYLETVLALNPNNSAASKRLAQMDQAIRSTETSSMSLGIKILALLIVILLLVGGLIWLITTFIR
jgi:thioredoxin-like negative regulator of GroEL